MVQSAATDDAATDDDEIVLTHGLGFFSLQSIGLAVR